MEIKISTRHGHISDQTQNNIRSKLEKLTRYFERLTAIDLTIDLERRDAPSLDLRVSAEHKHDFLASGQGELLSALDEVVEKMEQQLKKYKQKVQDRHRNAGH